MEPKTCVAINNSYIAGYQDLIDHKLLCKTVSDMQVYQDDYTTVGIIFATSLQTRDNREKDIR